MAFTGSRRARSSRVRAIRARGCSTQARPRNIRQHAATSGARCVSPCRDVCASCVRPSNHVARMRLSGCLSPLCLLAIPLGVPCSIGLVAHTETVSGKQKWENTGHHQLLIRIDGFPKTGLRGSRDTSPAPPLFQCFGNYASHFCFPFDSLAPPADNAVTLKYGGLGGLYVVVICPQSTLLAF